MALAMARPWLDPKTHVWHLRQRTPSDLLARLKGQLVTLPVGEEFTTVRVGAMIQASLRTKEPRKAKELHVVADAALKKLLEAHRTGPTRLTQKQITALSGTLYRAVVAEHEDDPGEPEGWLDAEAESMVARLSQPASSTTSLKIIPVRESQAARLDAIHGERVDAMLSREGLVVDGESRTALVRAVAEAFEGAALQLRRNAHGDYRPDPEASRFPDWVPPAPKQATPKAAERLTVGRLVDAWAAFQAGKLAPNTIKRYAVSLRSLAAFAGDREAGALTGDDLHEWAVQRRDKDGIAARVINKNDLVAVSSAFKWAMGREAGKLVPSNPVTGVSLTEDASAQARAKTFRPGEAVAILSAALAVQDDPKNPTSAFAKRWCPWLAAYSGARITELTGLTGEDVRLEDGVAVMAFTKTKTGIPRTVPLHPHLLALGFLDFVKERGRGPLFVDPRRRVNKNASTDLAEIRSRKLAQWGPGHRQARHGRPARSRVAAYVEDEGA